MSSISEVVAFVVFSIPGQALVVFGAGHGEIAS